VRIASQAIQIALPAIQSASPAIQSASPAIQSACGHSERLAGNPTRLQALLVRSFRADEDDAVLTSRAEAGERRRVLEYLDLIHVRQADIRPRGGRHVVDDVERLIIALNGSWTTYDDAASIRRTSDTRHPRNQYVFDGGIPDGLNFIHIYHVATSRT